MKRKYHFNKEAIGEVVGVAMACSVFFGVVGGVGTLVYNTINYSSWHNTYEDLTDNVTETKTNGIVYKLRGPHFLDYREDWVDFDFDFNNRIVLIDGRDEADTVIPFEEYPNPKAIEDARKSGCRISEQITALFNDPANPDVLEYFDEKAEKLREKGEVFHTNYCTKMPELDHTPLANTP